MKLLPKYLHTIAHRAFLERAHFCGHLNAKTLNQLLDNKREVALSESSDYSSCWCALGYKKSVGQRSLQKLDAIVLCIS